MSHLASKASVKSIHFQQASKLCTFSAYTKNVDVSLVNGGGGSLAILCNAFHFFFAGTIHISPKKYITGNVINSGLLIKSEEWLILIIAIHYSIK